LSSEIGDDTVQVNEVLDEDEGEDMGIVDEEESEVQINTYWPEATITAGKVSEVLVSVKVNESLHAFGSQKAQMLDF